MTEHNASRELNIKIVGVGVSSALSGRPMSLSYVVAHGTAALLDILAANLTNGKKEKVAQLEQDLNDLTKLINQLIEIEQQATKFIEARATQSSDTWFIN